MFICGAIDDLYQKSTCFSKLKLFFSIRSIRLSTVIVFLEYFLLILSVARSGPDQVPGAKLAEEQHENNLSYLSPSETPPP